MSSYYIFDTEKKSTSKESLPLDGSKQMTGDLDMNNQSIVGIKDINASNSVVSKNYVSGQISTLSSKCLLLDGIQSMVGDLSMGGQKIINLIDDTTGSSAATRTYVNGEITKLKNKTRPYSVYNYVFGCRDMRYNTWTYPYGPQYTTPHVWMVLDGLDEDSWFEFGSLSFDNNDQFLGGNYPFEFRLQCFESNGTLRSWTFFSGNINGYRIPSENFFCINLRKKFKDFPSGNYRPFKTTRLSVNRKFSGTQGNESMITFAIGK